MRSTALLFIFTLTFFSCQIEKKAEQSNSPREGFDLSNSDPAAIELADSVMIAVGGRENWDKTRFISWNAAGERSIFWDKKLSRARIENLKSNTIYLVNLNIGTGRVQANGREITEPDSLQAMLRTARSIFVNDVYWLVLPFKLKDSGVTLKYMGEDTLKGNRYNILQLTFPKVANAPQNKYKMYVDVKEKVIKYWSYYSDMNQELPTFTRPWDNYQKHGNILLSGDRSDGGGPKGVKVEENLSEKLFTEF